MYKSRKMFPVKIATLAALVLLFALILLLIFSYSSKAEAVTLSVHPDYAKGIMSFEARVTPMFVTQEPGVGEKNGAGYTYLGGGIWAKEQVVFFVTRWGPDGPTMWVWNSSNQFQIIGGQTTSLYTSYRYLLAIEAPDNYTAQVSVTRSVKYPPSGSPAVVTVEYDKHPFTLYEDTYKPQVTSFSSEQAPGQNLVFNATATRFVGNPSDPQYNTPWSTDPYRLYRGNGIYVKQYAGFVVSRKSDGGLIWSSYQYVPSSVNNQTGEESYTSGQFPTANQDLTSLNITVTVYKLIFGMNGVTSPHGWLYQKEASLYGFGLYVPFDPRLRVLGSESYSGSGGEPVNTSTGNYTYKAKDISIPGKGLPLEFIRTYNSQDTYVGALGYGWTHNYNTSLVFEPDNTITMFYPDGRRDTFTPNTDGTYNSPPGETSRLSKNADGSFTLKKKDQTKYNFRSDGKLANITDKNGNATTLTYDTKKRLTSVSDASGRTLSFTYDKSNRITKITDPSRRQLSYTYDANGDLATFKDARLNQTSYFYASHRITQINDPKGQPFVKNQYNGDKVSVQFDALGNQFTFTYDELNNQTTVTDPRGNQTIHRFDSQYRLVQEIDPLAHTTSYTYDSYGNRDSVTDKNGKTTISVFDANGNVTSIIDPLVNTTTMTYDSNNNLLSKTEPLGNTTNFSYDAKGNLTSITDPMGKVTNISYNTFGKPTSVTDANANTTSFAYDQYGNQTSVTDPLANTTSYTYDRVGRKTSQTDPLAHKTQFAYDANNNLTSVTDATNHTASYTYDGNNLLTSITDPNGHITFYTYDAMDNLTGVTDPLNNITTYAYDGNYNRKSMTDANGKTTNYTYDNANRMTDMTYADNSSVSFIYDAQGNRTSMVDQTGTTNYTYDALNRMTSAAYPNGKTVSYAYDASGRRSSMTDPSGVTSYSYDLADRLTTLTDPANAQTTFQYSNVGLRTKTVYPNGVSANYTYSAANQLTLLENKTSTNSVVSSFSYDYDSDGQRTKVTEVNGDFTTYTYDSLHRLTKEEKKDPSLQVLYSFTYTYDPSGNRLSRTDQSGGVVNYTYDNANRIQGAGTTTYTFDNNGNMTGKTSPQGTTTYSYDFENRLTNAALPGGTNNSFAYAGDAKRTRKTTPFGQTNYLYNGLAVIQETDQAGALIANYTTDPTALIGQIINSKDAAGVSSFYSYDGIGATRNLTDQSQAQIAGYTYDSFGNVLGQTGSSPNNYKFSTKELDQTGLYYFGARYYDPQIGRFLTKDPVRGNLWDPQSLNPYTYVKNNPLNLVDPLGLCPRIPKIVEYTGGYEPAGYYLTQFLGGTIWVDVAFGLLLPSAIVIAPTAPVIAGITAVAAIGVGAYGIYTMVKAQYDWWQYQNL